MINRFSLDSKLSAIESYKQFMETGSTKLVYRATSLGLEFKCPSESSKSSIPFATHLKHGVVEASMHHFSHAVDHHIADGLGRYLLTTKGIPVVTLLDAHHD